MKPATQATVYTTRFCPFCIRALALLERKGIAYDNIPVDSAPQLRQKMTEMAGSHRVPQIWIGDRHIGGCDELYELERRQQLDPLIAITKES